MSKHVDHATVRNKDWGIWQNDDGRFAEASVTRAILLDIREELRRLNRVLHCPNFLAIPQTLSLIQQQTRKPKRRKAKKVSK